ncbi:MAG TPA: DUF2314 domain-containing protein [Pyrinomonadaceae bacterium]|nr:DUF2314 domain-containing protein [Pyrinomonadaceae bacterium]
MKANTILLGIVVILGVAGVATPQQPKPEIYVAPNAPKDKPVSAGGSQAEQIEAAIKPYIEKAKSTYPQAKARFLSGLPPRHTFFVTTRLSDSSKRIEQVFIAVKEIKDGRISGFIASEIQLVSGYREGDAYSFPESELIDWTISKPDGTEEGNFVGNFLDSYQVINVGVVPVWKKEPATPARMNQRIDEAAIKLAPHAPVPRLVLYDIGYPHSEQEYTALDGNAVILFTALSQVRDELPLQKVYVVCEGKQIELKLLKIVLAELSPDTAPVKILGRFRADALYLLPMSLRLENCDLIVDFQKARLAFKVATFGTPLPDALNKLLQIKLSGAGLSQTALDAFIKREYPTFFPE